MIKKFNGVGEEIPNVDKELIKKYTTPFLKVDLACGEYKNKGFLGIDITPYRGVDIVHDLNKYPWPLPDNSVDLMVASHYVEHINPADFGFINFMNEAWRVMKPGGQFMIACPYAGSPGFWQDPTHCNGVSEITWSYFDPLSVNAGAELYKIYYPKPWKIIQNNWAEYGNMEVALEKRKEDRSYGREKGQVERAVDAYTDKHTRQERRKSKSDK